MACGLLEAGGAAGEAVVGERAGDEGGLVEGRVRGGGGGDVAQEDDDGALVGEEGDEGVGGGVRGVAAGLGGEEEMHGRGRNGVDAGELGGESGVGDVGEDGAADDAAALGGDEPVGCWGSTEGKEIGRTSVATSEHASTTRTYPKDNHILDFRVDVVR